MEYDLKKCGVVSRGIGKTVYHDKENNLCIKLFDESFSKDNILNEALNHTRIEQTALEIPPLYAVTQVEGRWAIIREFVKGKTLAQLMDENPDKMEEYLDLFVDVQCRIHQESCPLLSRLKDKMNTKISQTDLDATTRYELHTRLESMPKYYKVCHGDFVPSNVIISEDDGKPYVIDWAHVTQGSGGEDAARTYLLFCLAGRKKLANQYLNLFCKKADMAKQYVQKWMPIVAATQTLKGNPEERDFLLSWINVVDYE